MTDSHEHIRPLEADKSYPTDGLAEDLPVPEISKKFNWVLPPTPSSLLCLAFLSGVAAAVSFYFFGGPGINMPGVGVLQPRSPWFFWGPGIIFAVLVILPWCSWVRIPPVLTFFTFVLTPVGYFCAVHCSFNGWIHVFGHGEPRIGEGIFGVGVIAFVGAGAVGTAIMLAPLLLFGERRTRIAAAVTVFTGSLIGLVFWGGSFTLFTLFGLFIWQMVVAGGLSLAFRRETWKMDLNPDAHVDMPRRVVDAPAGLEKGPSQHVTAEGP